MEEEGGKDGNDDTEEEEEERRREERKKGEIDDDGKRESRRTHCCSAVPPLSSAEQIVTLKLYIYVESGCHSIRPMYEQTACSSTLLVPLLFLSCSSLVSLVSRLLHRVVSPV